VESSDSPTVRGNGTQARSLLDLEIANAPALKRSLSCFLPERPLNFQASAKI
jgi:hypothetical protein